ncbi:MAG: FtsX-like permease family protein [Lachnospiraceae bacterium]|nr:FtsX-like permease family protein [Lachnospiraceae bacterium]
MITFFCMTLITAFLLFISLSFMVDISKVLDKVYDNTHAADIMFFVSDDQIAREKMEEVIKGCSYVAEYEMTPAVVSDSAKYGHRGDSELSEYPFYFTSYEKDINIHQISIDTKNFNGNDILLPIRMNTEFKIGDYLTVKIGDNKYDFKVAGFVEDCIFCSPMNMGSYMTYISDRMYDDILFENSSAAYIRDIHKVRLTRDTIRKGMDPNDVSDELFNEVNDWITEYRLTHPDYTGGIMNNVPYSMLRTSAMITPLMFIAIIFVFALIIFVIAMVIIHFSVKNFIMTNMKNTAIMEAAGYTVKELVLILLVQLLSIAFAGALAGIILGSLTIGKLSIIILITLGLPWTMPVNTSLAFLTLAGLCMIVGGLTFVIGRDYSKTTVLDALRGGINAHNFKRNLFPFEHSIFPISVTLALKETFGRFKNHLGVFIIIMLLTAATVLGLGIADTFSDEDTVINMAGVDYTDVNVSGDINMGANLDNMTTVDFEYGEDWLALNYTSRKVRKEWTCTTRCFTDTSRIKGIAMVEGRLPAHSNEMMFATNAARTLKVSVGDAVTVKCGNREESYIITGICQVINNMGYMAYMTVEGEERVTSTPDDLTYNVFLKSGYDIKDFEKEFKDIYPDEEVVDFKQSVQSIVGMVKLGIKMVAFVIAIVTALVVAFVESLIIRTQITRSWRNLGVSKALGYTSSQLIVQTMFSNMPAVILGMIPGLVLSTVFGEKVMTLMFSIFGFKQSNYFINPSSYLFAFVIIAGIAMLTSAIVGRRIKSLNPVKMITEE